MFRQIAKNVLLMFFWGPVKYLAWLLPARYAYALSDMTSCVLCWLMARKAEKLHNELLQILPDGDEQYFRHSVRRAFWALLCGEYEMLLFPRLSADTIGRHITFRGIENLDAALLAGRGVMLLFAHFGANQMIMPAMGYRGYKMNQLSAPATVWAEKITGRSFGGMEKYAMRKRWHHEKSLPVNHINIFGSLKGAFRCLRQNEILGVAIDGGGGSERVAVDFLNCKANFSIGAVEIARRTGCVVLPTFMMRDTRTGKNELVIEKPLDINRGAESAASNRQFVQIFARRLEHHVRQSPWLYLNFLSLRRMMQDHDDVPFLMNALRGGKHEISAAQS